MGCTVRSLAPEHDIVEARFFGTNSAAEVEHAFGLCLALAQETDTWNLMADCSDLINAAPLADLKSLVEAIAALGVTDRFREALVQPTDVTAAVSVGFWEVAGINRGLDMKVFRERDDAIAWLEA